MVSFDNASMPYKMVTANSFEMAHFIRVVTKEALLGGVSHVTHLNFKTSRVGVYICLSLIVGFAVTVAIWQRKLGCLLSRFHFTRCRYFLSHVACRNLPWQGLTKEDRASERKMEHEERPTIVVQFPTNYRFHIPCNLKS